MILWVMGMNLVRHVGQSCLGMEIDSGSGWRSGGGCGSGGTIGALLRCNHPRCLHLCKDKFYLLVGKKEKRVT